MKGVYDLQRALLLAGVALGPLSCTDPVYGPQCDAELCAEIDAAGKDSGANPALEAGQSDALAPGASAHEAGPGVAARYDGSIADAAPLASDARVPLPEAASPDGGSTWRDSFQGHYGIRMRAHARVGGGLGTIANELLWLGKVVEEAGRVFLDTQYCFDRTQVRQWAFGQTNLEVVKPDGLPGRKLEVIYENGMLHTVGAPALIGYSAVEPAGCETRTSISTREQPWNASGLCTCPSTSAPPTSPDDCRVTDPDGDRKPGYTVSESAGGSSFAYLRTRDASQFVEVQIAADGRHRGTWSKDYDQYTLDCSRTPCSRATTSLCPGTAPYTVEFAPVDAALTCAELTRESIYEGRHFVSAPLTPPPECSE